MCVKYIIALNKKMLSQKTCIGRLALFFQTRIYAFTIWIEFVLNRNFLNKFEIG